jgi:long-subunit fatty acid transport protein
MNKIQRLVLVVVVVGLNIQLKAQKYSNEFLSIGVGARAQAMGSSVVASSSDAFSIFWNPAGLVDIENNGLQLGIMHAEWFAGIGKHDVFSFSMPMQNKNSRLGFCAIWY